MYHASSINLSIYLCTIMNHRSMYPSIHPSLIHPSILPSPHIYASTHLSILSHSGSLSKSVCVALRRALRADSWEGKGCTQP